MSLAGHPEKAKVSEFISSGIWCVTADVDDLLLVQGSGEHGAVSSLPVGMGHASGRVDVPDGTKFGAAAACLGTFRSRPGKLDALGSVQSREVKVQFF